MVESAFTLASLAREAHPVAAHRRERLIAAFLLLGATAVYAALVALQITRNLWFDELLTLYIARENSLSKLLSLVERWDLNPPVLHVLAHFSLRLAHGNPIAARIPSVIAFYFASLLLYVYGARKMGRVFAVLPVLLLWYSPLFNFATEARPYAALCFWFCALLVFWDSAVNAPYRGPRGLVIGGVALSAIGLMATHVFAPFSILPFVVAEAVRARRHRVSDLSLWLALTLPLMLTFAYLPFLANFRSITEYPPAFQAGLRKVVSFYGHTVLDVVAAVAVAALAAWLMRRFSSPAQRTSLTRPEVVLWITLVGVPILLDVLMVLEQAPFWGRYCITSALGLYFICSYLLTLISGARLRAGQVAAAAVGLLLLIQRLAIPAYVALSHPKPRNFAAVETIDSDLPLVAASGLTFGEMGFYESPATSARLFYLLDRPAAIQFAHATMFEDLAEFQRSFQLPGTVESFGNFTRDHKHFLVIGTFNYPEDWLLRKLAADGAQIRPLGNYSTPYKDKSLFEVRLR